MSPASGRRLLPVSRSVDHMAPLDGHSNPDTPLAFLPPDIAFEVQIGGYVLAGTLGVMLVYIFLLKLTPIIRVIFGTFFAICITTTNCLRNIAWDSQLSYILSPGMRLKVRNLNFAENAHRIGSLLYILSCTLFESEIHFRTCADTQYEFQRTRLARPALA
jgi:hypothetical protein